MPWRANPRHSKRCGACGSDCRSIPDGCPVTSEQDCALARYAFYTGKQWRARLRKKAERGYWGMHSRSPESDGPLLKSVYEVLGERGISLHVPLSLTEPTYECAERARLQELADARLSVICRRAVRALDRVHVTTCGPDWSFDAAISGDDASVCITVTHALRSPQSVVPAHHTRQDHIVGYMLHGPASDEEIDALVDERVWDIVLRLLVDEAAERFCVDGVRVKMVGEAQEAGVGSGKVEYTAADQQTTREADTTSAGGLAAPEGERGGHTDKRASP